MAGVQLRAAARVAVAVGAAGSVALTLHAGRDNPSRILMTLFALWVSGPFLVAVLGDMASKRWMAHTRTAFYSGILLLTLASLSIYGVVALGPPRGKTAFVFVVVPPVSCLLMAVVILAVSLVCGRRSRRDRDGARGPK